MLKVMPVLQAANERVTLGKLEAAQLQNEHKQELEAALAGQAEELAKRHRAKESILEKDAAANLEATLLRMEEAHKEEKAQYTEALTSEIEGRLRAVYSSLVSEQKTQIQQLTIDFFEARLRVKDLQEWQSNAKVTNHSYTPNKINSFIRPRTPIILNSPNLSGGDGWQPERVGRAARVQ